MSLMDAVYSLGDVFKGDKKQNTNTGTTTTTATTRRKPQSRYVAGGSSSYSMPLDQEPMDTQMFEALRERKTVGSESQRRVYKELLDDFKKYKSAVEKSKDSPDLSGFLGAADAIAGTNYLRNYRPPKSRDAKRKELLQMQSGLNKLARGLSLTDVELLRAQFQPRGGNYSESMSTKGSGGSGEKDFTAAQYNAAAFGKSMLQANRDLDQLASEGYNRSDRMSALDASLPNWMASGNSKRQRQAEENFVNALLRKESGAAVPDQELARYEKAYFVRAGDTPEVIAQKKASREQKLAGLRASAGGAWDVVQEISAVDKIRDLIKGKEAKEWSESLLGPRSQGAQQQQPMGSAAQGSVKGAGAATRKQAPKMTKEEFLKSIGRR